MDNTCQLILLLLMCLLLNLSISIQLSVKKFFHCKQYIRKFDYTPWNNSVFDHQSVCESVCPAAQSFKKRILVFRVHCVDVYTCIYTSNH